MSRVEDNDMGFGALFERTMRAGASVSVGVAEESPAAQYAGIVELRQPFLRPAVDSSVGIIRDGLAAAAIAELEGDAPRTALEQTAEAVAEKARAAVPVRSGQLRSEIQVIKEAP